MKKRILTTFVALLSCFSIAALPIFAGCNRSNSTPTQSDTDDKQPDVDKDENKNALVYKGMSASDNASNASVRMMSSVTAYDSAVQAEYSAYRNEEFYIEVRFDNPNNYTVLGLTISYAGTSDLFPCSSFEEDFDSESVFVKVRAKKSAEIDVLTEYSISNITYSDGEEIKSAVYAEGANQSIFVEIKQYGAEVDKSQAITGTKLNCLSSGMLSADGVLTIPQGITEIGKYAFAYNEDVKEVVIPDTVETINAGAFYDCLSLKKVTIGLGVKFIDKNVFHNCEKISYVNYTGTLADWCKIDFAYSASEQVERMRDGANADKGVRYSNPTFYAHDLHINGELVTEVTIPQDITTIKYATFARCTSITKVVLHENVTAIGFYAFLTCTGINEIDLGCVQMIDSAAFNGCYSLTRLTLPETLTEIKSGAFTAAEKILEIYNLSELQLDIGRSTNGAVAKFAKQIYSKTPEESNFETDEKGLVWYSNSERQQEIMLVGYVGGKTEITVPYMRNEKRVVLKECAFAGNTVLEKVTFGDGFTEIPDRLFAYCFTLKEVLLPDTVTSIGDHAFWSSGLKNIVLPENCTYLKRDAFSECKDLKITIKATQLTFEKFALGLNKNLQIRFAGTVEQWSEYVNALNSSTTSQGMLYNSEFTAICSNGTYKAYGI